MSELRDNRVFAELEKHKTKHIIICGFGRVGQVVAERLAAAKERFVVIDPDAEAIAYAKRLGYLGIQGNSENGELLVQSGIQDRAERVLCLTGSDVVNVYITLTARDLNPEIEIISRANTKASIQKLYQAGANHTVAPFKAVGAIAGEYIGQPVAFEAIHGILSGQNGIGLETVAIRSESLLAGRKVSDIDFAGYKLILFGVISHLDRHPDEDTVAYDLKWNRIHFNPKGGFRLSGNDLLVLIGHEYSITHFKDRLESGEL